MITSNTIDRRAKGLLSLESTSPLPFDGRAADALNVSLPVFGVQPGEDESPAIR